MESNIVTGKIIDHGIHNSDKGLYAFITIRTDSGIYEWIGGLDNTTNTSKKTGKPYVMLKITESKLQRLAPEKDVWSILNEGGLPYDKELDLEISMIPGKRYPQVDLLGWTGESRGGKKKEKISIAEAKAALGVVSDEDIPF